jgi:glyoxylase-like metal-dependent hydrolase (beta-lactamase superfamily II)
MSGIPFVRDLNAAYGEMMTLTPLIRRLLAPNPGPFTFRGTGVYVIGRGEVAVIDPGPDIPEHFDALKRALETERITHVLVTHSHSDHSPLAHPLAQWAGCQVFASGRRVMGGAEIEMEAEEDARFRPDVALRDGDRLHGPGWTLEAIETPGHTSNHLCFALHEENALFSGDHVMGWSTTVISPPDGRMGDYLDSLARVRARDFSVIWPTHGAPITETGPFLDAYVRHRLARERSIVDRLAAGDTRIPQMVSVIYRDVDARLHPAACHSVLAHMIHLIETGRVTASGSGLDADYSLMI